MADNNITSLINQIKGQRDTIYTHITGSDDGQWGMIGVNQKLSDVATKVVSVKKQSVASETKLAEGEGKTFTAGYYPSDFTVSVGQVTRTYTQVELDLNTEDGINVIKQGRTINETAPDLAIDYVKITGNPSLFRYETVNTPASKVLSGTSFINGSNDADAVGTMPNNNAVDVTLDISTPLYKVPLGYHNGDGTVKLVPEVKTVSELLRTEQTIEPTTGKVLSQVIVPAISSKLQDVSGVTVVQSQVLNGENIYFVDDSGAKLQGTMPNHGEKNVVLTTTDDDTSLSTGYYAGGTISVKSTTKTVDPILGSEDLQVKGDDGAFLTSVFVKPIPNQIAGSTQKMDGINVDSYTFTGDKYYTTDCVVTFDDSTIVNMLQQI